MPVGLSTTRWQLGSWRTMESVDRLQHADAIFEVEEKHRVSAGTRAGIGKDTGWGRENMDFQPLMNKTPYWLLTKP